MTGIYRSEAGARLCEIGTRRRWSTGRSENERRQLPTPEGDTFVIAAGRNTAPPLLHGSGSDNTQRLGRMAELSAHFRVYAVDVIGDPELSAPTRPPWDSSRYAEWLDAVLDSLGVAFLGDEARTELDFLHNTEPGETS